MMSNNCWKDALENFHLNKEYLNTCYGSIYNSRVKIEIHDVSTIITSLIN